MSEQLLRNMEQMFPKLKFHYQFIETGCEFYGRWNTEESRHEVYEFLDLERLVEDYIELKSDLYTDSFLKENYDGDKEHMRQDAWCDIIAELETMICDAGDSLTQFTAEDVWNYIEGNYKYAEGN